MSFVHPWIFWTGLGAVSAPILIHLLNRSRFRRRDWAAMQFLLQSMRRNRRRLRIEELILLVLRCLIILALATALARPTVSAATALATGPAAKYSTVFILDDSYSMAQKFASQTIFSVARSDLAGAVKQLSPTGRLAVVLTARPGEKPFFDLAFVADEDMDALAARLAGLRPSDRRGDLAGALARAEKLLAGTAGPKRLHVLSDFRRIDLVGPGPTGRLRKQLAALKRQEVDLLVTDYGRPARNNLTVEAIELADRLALANVPVRVALTVRNNSPRRVENVAVHLTLKLARQTAGPDGKIRQAEMVAGVIESIEPRGSTRLETKVTFDKADFTSVSLKLPADELAGDNQAHLALRVIEAVKVLAVDGRVDLADPTNSESYFLTSALDPNRNGEYGSRVDVISVESLGAVDFGEYDLVVLLNVASFPTGPGAAAGPADYPQLKALERYVRGGGGLAVFPGDRINPTFYNGAMFSGGRGLLPFRIGPRVGDPARKDSFYRLAPKSIANVGMMRCFLGQAAAMTHLIRFFAFLPADEHSVGPAWADVAGPCVLARFNDPRRSPALVMRRFGKGTVLAAYTTASTRWNDWPIDEMGTFPVVMNDMVFHLARAGRQNLTGRVGQPIVYDPPARLKNPTRAVLQTPSYRRADLTGAWAGGSGPSGRLHYDRAHEAGVYSLRLTLPDRTTARVLLARNVDGAEGDLTPGGRDNIAAAFGTSEFGYKSRFGRQADRRVDLQGPKREYWQWIIAAVGALLALEVMLGRKFGHYE